MSESEQQDKGFKVTDRRKFTPEGHPRADVDSERESRVPENEKGRGVDSQSQPERSMQADRPTQAERPTRQRKPSASAAEVGFADLVTMLATNAWIQLGEVEEPASGERVENLPGAQVMINLLAMLKDKTKGNLSGDEERMLENILYDLRMRFVQKADFKEP